MLKTQSEKSFLHLNTVELQLTEPHGQAESQLSSCSNSNSQASSSLNKGFALQNPQK